MSPPPANDTQFAWYLAGAGAWFLAFGIQMVMFSYLVTTELHGSEMQIALAQASLTIVSMALLLLGGTVADRADARRVLILCHTAALIPATALAAIIWFGALRYEWLIVYGLAMGAITAFTIPAREALMGDVIGNDRTRIQRAVTTTIGITFLLQIVGMLTARFAAQVGAAPIILIQTAAQLVGLYTAYRLYPSTRHSDHGQADGGSAVDHILEGLREVASSPVLLPINVLTLAIGVLFIGAFMVLLPLILRSEFGASVQQISTLQASFWTGSIVASIVISRIGNIVNRGRLIIGAVSTGTVILVVMSFKGPLILLYALVFIWGCGAGVMMSMSRTTVQEHAPPAHRARILSIYQLGFTGGMSIGALLTGIYATALGPREATLVPAAVMALVILYLVTRTKLWSITALKHEANAPE
jgi:MFS family permease